MKLDCRNAQRMIQSYLERELDDRDCASFLAHVKSCPKCMEELETSFMIIYVLKYLDDERDRSFDIKKLLRDDIARNERRLNTHRALSFLIWVAILAMAVAIVLITLTFFFPQFLPEIGHAAADVVRRLFGFFM